MQPAQRPDQHLAQHRPARFQAQAQSQHPRAQASAITVTTDRARGEIAQQLPPPGAWLGLPRSARLAGCLLIILLPLLLSGCGDDDREEGLSKQELALEAPDGSAVEISWDDLIPADWQPEALMEEYDAENLSDEDPRAQELMDKLKALWAEAPVVEALNDRLVRLPGFVVPLENDEDSISEFLLVPYFGACIHVPPPPANQTILVTTPADQPYVGALFDTVWVEGRMHVEPFRDELGDAGYRIEATGVSLYEEL
ncbi:DUF3299 domain-containing protein [Lamprobacter modestohalophilus]|uniref:DUF3299 domain-containing protein n=1 Tax=Lamprobacter modestohalophilus TaxID=1064514 RepID=UPI002ADEB3F9|nr:DUF3299 domain-containing protein [Lamprobacter modestohalophilus]MEA1049504.1 DUF3299 domain-containing protein [Lamprobacter modestohalophilus]